MPSLQMKIRAFDYSVKGVDDSGKFSGYASVFGNVDSYNEVVAPGAFSESLADLGSKERGLPVLWQHRIAEPIGHWDMSALKEDATGLYGAGELWLEEAPYARIAHRGMKANAITGLSIGYYVRADSFDDKTRVRTLTKLDLVEISIVTTPANDDARVDSIKSIIQRGGYPTLREFEEVQRELGFSRSAAAAIATGGYKQFLNRRDGGEELSSDELTAALRGLNLPTF